MAAEIILALGKNQRSDVNKEFVKEFKNIPAHELIFTKFQPIVCLVTGDIVAYEALSRGPEGSIFENPVILFEVTERAFIKGPELFYSVLEHYQSQGFSIAMDDFGSGSAGIKLISETSPQIVKIDKFLTENIDKSTKKQGILKMIVEMFNRNRELLGVPVGLVMKTELFVKLGKQFGFDLFDHRPVSYVMNVNFLTVDVNQSVDFVARQVLLRDQRKD